MTPADIAAALAVLTLPVPVGILYRRRRAIRRATLRARVRRDWARGEYLTALQEWNTARQDYRAARREAVQNYYRAARASRRDRRAIRKAHRQYRD